jgi:TolB-like protein/Tfp pilus assembly protein PilF
MCSLLHSIRQFFAELRRRKVYRVALAYLAAGFVVVELADIAAGAFRLPGWFGPLVWTLAGLGFPLALVIAWAFDVTPEGIRRTPGLDDRAARADEAPARKAPEATDAAGASADSHEDADPEGRMIAVLPFTSLGAREPSPLTEGMHDALLTRLTNASDLEVIARTSVQQYRDTEKTTRQIADELGVTWILEGGVQEMDEQIRVNAQLIDPQTETHAWAQSYRKDLSAENVFELQEEITKTIARSLKAQLSEEETERIEQRPTENLDAYRLHAQGREHLDQRTEAEIRRALDCFEEALELDAGYALAWVGLADALTLLYEYGYETADQALRRAEEAARRALDIDPKSAEAHASCGLLHEARRQGPEAVHELQRAVELKPNYAEAHNWLSWVYRLLGRPADALERAKRAVELNPLSREAVGNLSMSHLATGNYERALAEARRADDLELSWGAPRFSAALALYELGRFDDAASVLRDLSAPWADIDHRTTLALVHVATGNEEEARALLQHFENSGAPFSVGLIHAALGDIEAAFDAFRRVERWSAYGPTLAVRYYYRDVWRSLREDSHYEELLRKVNRGWGLTPDGHLPAETHRQ